MTLVLDLDLNILKIYLHAKNEVLGQDFRKRKHEQDRHRETDATECITTPHSWWQKRVTPVAGLLVAYKRRVCCHVDKSHD